MESESLARLVIAGVALMTFLFYAVRINDELRGLSWGVRIVRLSVAAIFLVAAYGSVETMTIEPPVPLGIRNVLVPLFLIGVLLGLWMSRGEDHTPARRVDDACTFPGCIVARKDLRAAAEKYPHGIPPHVVLAIVDGVEAHEHRNR